jgi:hypothetical protein
VETGRVPGSREHAVALTKEGRSLLEHHRARGQGHRQTFWDGLKREREREHDLQVYRAYEREAGRLADRGGSVERVVLDHELKRETEHYRGAHAASVARSGFSCYGGSSLRIGGGAGGRGGGGRHGGLAEEILD